MIHNYRLERKTVTAYLGILALSLGLLGDVSAADIRIKPQAKPEQPAQSENEALGQKIVKVAKPQTFTLPGDVKLVIKRFEVTQVGKLEIGVNLKAQIKKKNPVPIPGNKYISTTGVIKVRFGVATKGGQLCTPSVSITGVNFKNVQNDVEQAAKEAVNEYLQTLLPQLCVPIKV
jgi:hypothetical protein